MRRVLAALVAAMLLGGCAANARTPRHEPGTLIEVTRTDGATMNPLFAQTVEDGVVYAQLLFESLTYVGPDYLPHPRLATSWSHSPDGKHWTVDLRRGVRWSDGRPFTSKDVVFTFGAMMDPKTAALAYSDLTDIRRVRAAGPYRVLFDLAQPSATFLLTALGEFIVPEHVLGRVPHERLRFTDFGEHPVGTGPYQLARWQHDSETVFVRNPYAWRRPHIRRIDVRTIFDDQSALQALMDGSVDLYDDVGSTDYRQILRLKPPGIATMTFPSIYLDVTDVNVRRPGLNDVAVRRAMMYAVDRQALIHGIFGDKVERPVGLIPVALQHWYTDRVMQYPYDPVKARAILDAAGWLPGKDGIRRRGGDRLSFELLLNQGSSILTDVELATIADWRAVGIDVHLRLLDFPSMLQRELQGKFDLVAIGFGGSVDPDLTAVLSTTAFPPNGANYGHFQNAKIDGLLKAGRVELDDRKRVAIYHELQREVAAQVPYFWDFGRFAGLGYNRRLHLDPRTTLQSPLLYYNVEDWTIDS